MLLRHYPQILNLYFMIYDFLSFAAYRASGRIEAALKCEAALVANNIGLVIKIAAKFQKSTGLPIDDLKQEGAVGLLKAIRSFAPDRGLQFSSFAVPKIRGEILHYLRDRAPLLRVPRPYWDAYKLVIAQQKALEKQGYSFSLKTIAGMKGISEAEWREFSIACTSRISDGDFDLPSHRPSHREDRESEFDSGAIYGALAGLPEVSRMVFVGFAMGATVKDLAEANDREEADIQADIDRSRQILKAQLV